MSTGSDTGTISLPCVFSMVAMTKAVPRATPVMLPRGLFTARVAGSLLCQVTALAGGVCKLLPSKNVTLGSGLWSPTKTESRTGSSATNFGSVVDSAHAASAAQSAQVNEARVIAWPQGYTACRSSRADKSRTADQSTL